MCRVGLGKEAEERLALSRPHNWRNRVDQVPGLRDQIVRRGTSRPGFSLSLGHLSVRGDGSAHR